MTRNILVTGGGGLVGRFIVEHFFRAADRVRVGGRTPPAADFFSSPAEFGKIALEPDFDFRPSLEGMDVVVHGAFSHVPGRYRGGEGDDPAAFRRQNLEGSERLFRDAKASGVKALFFLSSRATYPPVPPGTPLEEGMIGEPETLYGQVKKEGEAILRSLAGPDFTTASLRITGVYGPSGPGIEHKWAPLFTQFRDGNDIPLRAATEVHGEDVGTAICTLLEAEHDQVSGNIYNVSDIIVDTRDILSPLATALGRVQDLPPPSDKNSVCAMETRRLRGLGWRPGGRALFEQTSEALAARFLAS